MRRALIVLSLLLATPAAAAEHGGGEKKEVVGQYVDISVVALPVIAQGKLINYVFVSLRLNLNKGVDPVSLREKEPYFRDALVRGAHRTPFTDPKSYIRLDEAALKRFMMAEAARIAGPRAVANVQIVTAQPKQVSGLPKPG
jgi:hypothetical protein